MPRGPEGPRAGIDCSPGIRRPAKINLIDTLDNIIVFVDFDVVIGHPSQPRRCTLQPGQDSGEAIGHLSQSRECTPSPGQECYHLRSPKEGSLTSMGLSIGGLALSERHLQLLPACPGGPQSCLGFRVFHHCLLLLTVNHFLSPRWAAHRAAPTISVS